MTAWTLASVTGRRILFWLAQPVIPKCESRQMGRLTTKTPVKKGNLPAGRRSWPVVGRSGRRLRGKLSAENHWIRLQGVRKIDRAKNALLGTPMGSDLLESKAIVHQQFQGFPVVGVEVVLILSTCNSTSRIRSGSFMVSIMPRSTFNSAPSTSILMKSGFRFRASR